MWIWIFENGHHFENTFFSPRSQYFIEVILRVSTRQDSIYIAHFGRNCQTLNNFWMLKLKTKGFFEIIRCWILIGIVETPLDVERKKKYLKWLPHHYPSCWSQSPVLETSKMSQCQFSPLCGAYVFYIIHFSAEITLAEALTFRNVKCSNKRKINRSTLRIYLYVLL